MKKRPIKEPTELSINAVHGDPQTAEEILRKYGTYNIQPTADTDRFYPTIAQGLPQAEKDQS